MKLFEVQIRSNESEASETYQIYVAAQNSIAAIYIAYFKTGLYCIVLGVREVPFGSKDKKAA